MKLNGIKKLILVLSILGGLFGTFCSFIFAALADMAPQPAVTYFLIIGILHIFTSVALWQIARRIDALAFVILIIVNLAISFVCSEVVIDYVTPNKKDSVRAAGGQARS